MHYIIGTKIAVGAQRPAQKIRPGMSSAQIKATSRGLASGNYNEQRSLLTPNETYTLIRIFMKDEKVCYKMVGDKTVELLFSSVKDAETFISEIRGEQVPDYEEINRNKTD